MTDLPSERAFLVQLSAQTSRDLESLGGRVEHVSSGRATRFGSQAELWAFVAGVLAAAAPGDEAARPEGRQR